MVAYLEHANITVPDIDAAIAFLQMVEPAFAVRHDASPAGTYRWAHIGTDQGYIALQEPHVDAAPQPAHRPYKDYGVNHLGWVVDDLHAVVCRLEEHGYRRGMPWRRILIASVPITTMRRVLNRRLSNTFLIGQKNGIYTHKKEDTPCVIAKIAPH